MRRKLHDENEQEVSYNDHIGQRFLDVIKLPADAAMGDENKVNAYVHPQLQQNHGKKVFLKSPKDVLERGRRLFGRRVTVVLNKDYSAEAA